MNPAVGSALWTLLHAFAKAYPNVATEDDKARALGWLDKWGELVEQNAIGCGSCHRKWALLIERNPPSLSGSTAFYHWTVAVHDWINRELGKPLFDTAICLHYQNFGVRLPNG